jgi:hypothetical protein
MKYRIARRGRYALPMHESVRIDNPDGYLRAIIGQCPLKDQLGFLFGKTDPTVPRGFSSDLQRRRRSAGATLTFSSQGTGHARCELYSI